MNYRSKKLHAAEVLKALGLPSNLIDLIKNRTLHSEIERAYKTLDKLNALEDLYEAQNPEDAARLPWFKARQEWIKEGRPRPAWYEALMVLEGKNVNVGNFRNLTDPYSKMKTPENIEKWRKGGREHQRRKRGTDPKNFGWTVPKDRRDSYTGY